MVFGGNWAQTDSIIFTIKLKIPPIYDIFIAWRIKMNFEFVQSSKEILGGVPVFSGTRVPIQNLLDYLEAGDSIDLFLEDFPTVKKDQAIQALKFAKVKIMEFVHENIA
jgi:uncharacterized protein (DUF433 family)